MEFYSFYPQICHDIFHTFLENLQRTMVDFREDVVLLADTYTHFALRFCKMYAFLLTRN